MSDSFRTPLDAIPEGISERWFNGLRCRVEKTTLANDRSSEFTALELGVTDYISLNHYRLKSGGLLKPCEMAEGRVRGFVLG